MCTFDTLKFAVRCGFWRSDLDPEIWEQSHGVKVRTSPARVSKGVRFDASEVRKSWRLAQDRASGLRVFGTLEEPQSIEFSLPRVAHGTNAVLLRPEAVDAAMGRVLGLLGAVSDGARLADPLRVDMADHLPDVRPIDGIASLRGIRHPAIRQTPVEYTGTGLDWRGSELHVRFYDKGAEQGSPGGPMRLEVQMRGSKVPGIWDGSRLDSKLAYYHYRKHVLAMVPRPLYRAVSVVQKLAALEAAGTKIDGRPVYEFWGADQHPKRRAKLAADVLAQVAPRWLLDLRSRYPESLEWPELIDAPVGMAQEAIAA
jgi:hypothetical protein